MKSRRKMFRLLSFLMLIAVVSLSGCADDEEIKPDAKMSARIDGNGWNAVLFEGSVISGQLGLTGTSDDGRIIILSVKAEEGSYDLSQALTTNTLTFRTVIGSNYISNLCTDNGEGTITISSIDTSAKTVNGTFSGKLCTTGGQTSIITEGRLQDFKYR